jgi:hypothetical protein
MSGGHEAAGASTGGSTVGGGDAGVWRIRGATAGGVRTHVGATVNGRIDILQGGNPSGCLNSLTCRGRFSDVRSWPHFSVR